MVIFDLPDFHLPPARHNKKNCKVQTDRMRFCTKPNQKVTVNHPGILFFVLLIEYFSCSRGCLRPKDVNCFFAARPIKCEYPINRLQVDSLATGDLCRLGPYRSGNLLSPRNRCPVRLCAGQIYAVRFVSCRYRRPQITEKLQCSSFIAPLLPERRKPQKGGIGS